MTEPSVLVVDDEEGIVALCERLLRREGFVVFSETDPRRAMERLREIEVDLLLVDIRMPEVDGFSLISYAKQHQPDIAVLVMTGFGTVETAIQALRQGVDGLLLKPFERGRELVDAVRQALADNQKKRDAARVQALRPLFDVTESLLTETQPERLLERILDAVTGHLRCEHAGYYEYSADDGMMHLLAGRGATLPDEASSREGGVIGRADALGVPLRVNVSGPGDGALQETLRALGLESALCAPISRLNVRSVLFAARGEGEPPFREADLDMFLILARQAAVAMENARLYAELRDYVRQVEESQRALIQAEKMATVGRLTASIAHEINNPLQAVRNCLHLAEREDVPPEKRAEYFVLAKSELERLMETVQRMLEFYRPGTARAEAVDVRDLLNRVLGLMAQQMARRRVEVQTDVSSRLPPVFVVSSQIQQVFINLILNAMDAMPQGGTLYIKARRARDGVEVLFRDSGPGVPPEHRSSIFEPFVSTKEGGVGLGLTVSYNIISAHGGVLELVSDDENEGQGACFRVWLPLGERE
ncbi:MAG: response regulator [Anaerolineae bacterium]|nr:MAG: response regulator [Anaerolineae bacterium]